VPPFTSKRPWSPRTSFQYSGGSNPPRPTTATRRVRS
jgi:hypothetical protein